MTSIASARTENCIDLRIRKHSHELRGPKSVSASEVDLLREYLIGIADAIARLLKRSHDPEQCFPVNVACRSDNPNGASFS